MNTVGMVLEQNGAIVATAASDEVLGHPALAVAWLANKLADGQSLEPSDVFRASFGGIGSVKARFVD